jgi:hypothetical protein
MDNRIGFNRRAGGLAAGLGALLAASAAQGAPADDSIIAAINAGHPIVEVRSRYEHVDQPGLPNSADAFTTRLLIGWETANWRGLKTLVEYKIVQHLGEQDFNTTTNGRTTFPVVADPDTQELNLAQVVWKPASSFQAGVGRQRVLIDDQRFIGNAGWRQDEQTFDAARADVAFGRLTATYAYLEKVNRVYGTRLDWSCDCHLVNAGYAVVAPLRLEGFYYALDFRQAPASSTETWGARLTGRLKARPLTLAYGATWARQSDYRNNPGRFSLDFREGDAAATAGITTVKVVYESLQGDGQRGFSTPLATLHAHLGWDDVFLTTPKDGLQNVNVALDVKPKLKLGPLHGVDLTARWFDFHTERTGKDLGREWDVSLGAALGPKLTVLAKFAEFDAAEAPLLPYVSRRKVWLMLEYKL